MSMSSELSKQLEKDYGSVIAERNMQLVGQQLRRILSEQGIGVALLVAHLHGLKVGHIPEMKNDAGQVLQHQSLKINAVDDSYTFVHVPVRTIRSDKNKLINRGIMNKNADPIGFIYHEDGLISTFSFNLSRMNAECGTDFSEEDVSTFLEHLALQGILVPANVNNRQIQFKDSRAKHMIESSDQKVYVKFDDRPISEKTLILPAKYSSSSVLRFIANTIRFKSACNYCSVNALNPLEATIHSTPLRTINEPQGAERSTVRNYQFGFTFAPFGDPTEVCHFVAWDFPHINEQVMNMDPQWYSFSDLIKLVMVINRDIETFCMTNNITNIPAVSGVCNHWAGNSLYHQHYQFFIIHDMPVFSKNPNRRSITSIDGVTIQRFEWPTPLYEISSTSKNDDENIMFVADRVAKNWEELNEGFDDSYGNGIKIKNFTQNIFVTHEEKGTRAIFVPRFRDRLQGKVEIAGNIFEKKNLGILETLGYFLVDDVNDFEKLKNLKTEDRNNIGNAWLSQIAPPEECVAIFEQRVAERLTHIVIEYERDMDRSRSLGPKERIDLLCKLLMKIKSDKKLNCQQYMFLAERTNELLKETSPKDAYTTEDIEKLRDC